MSIFKLLLPLNCPSLTSAIRKKISENCMQAHFLSFRLYVIFMSSEIDSALLGSSPFSPWMAMSIPSPIFASTTWAAAAAKAAAACCFIRASETSAPSSASSSSTPSKASSWTSEATSKSSHSPPPPPPFSTVFVGEGGGDDSCRTEREPGEEATNATRRANARTEK